MELPIDDRPTLPAAASDLAILRRYEPVIFYTQGEAFFPLDVESYVSQCSLWSHSPDGRDKLLVPQGKMTMDELVNEPLAVFGTLRYLRFVETLSLAETAQVLAAQNALHRQQQQQRQRRQQRTWAATLAAASRARSQTRRDRRRCTAAQATAP